MQVYTSRAFELKKDIDTVYELASNPSNLASIAGKFSQHLKDLDLELNEKEIQFKAPVIGVIRLTKTEEVAPNTIKYEATKSSIPLSVILNFSKSSEEVTLGQISLEVNVPPFLSSMVKNKVEPALEKVSTLLEQVDFNRLLK